MKFALVNPPWTFDGSIYFGCREPHLPLEYGYARALLTAAGHDVLVVDAQLHAMSNEQIAAELEAFRPDRVVITTAPSYLFWRCAPPELRVPQRTLRAVRTALDSRTSHVGPRTSDVVTIVVGPHASTTPGATLRKLGADAVVLGECEEILPRLALTREAWADVPSIAYVDSTGTL